FAHKTLARFRAVRSPLSVYDLQRDGSIERFIDRAIGDSHRAMAQLTSTTIRMMLDRLSTELIRRQSKCGFTLACFSIQTGSNQTGDATEIASGGSFNGRAAYFADTCALSYGRHCDFLMQLLPAANIAALHLLVAQTSCLWG